MDWPKLPDDTIDWMTVFQAPGTGLIAQLEQATTSAQLKACFTVVINALFSRKNDAEIRTAFLTSADELFGEQVDETDDSDLGAQQVKLRMIMMRLMNERMQRSRAHTAVKTGTGSARDEARLADDNQLAALDDV